MKTFSTLWNRWKAFSLKVATFQARIILTIFYFVALAPVGLIHTFVRDTLNQRGRRIEGWQDHKKRNIIDDLRQQY